ncbi:phage major capsid protein [Polycladidibacter hongkongensis]|uniref:phage major capsid protein n=1 Tax=Polycladidibacter hongkongensis TaxID=1647556 RepID=UPI0008377643|nr:phage major capsid protein [Pseudovibrio hongkongensis]
MPFTSAEIENITNTTLDAYDRRGQVTRQDVQDKPMLKAFDKRAKSFVGGKEKVTAGVRAGAGQLSLAGYSHDDQVSYGNPVKNKRAGYKWREHHIGMGITHTELKMAGIEVIERDGTAVTSPVTDAEAVQLANLLDEKVIDFEEDYDIGLDALLHGDGTTDAKALAGVGAFILLDPAAGTTGGVSRGANPWWRNRAATKDAHDAGSGDDAITSSPTGGGTLIQYMQKEHKQLNRFSQGKRRSMKFAGSDYIDAYERELRANGLYTQRGWANGATKPSLDGFMPAVSFADTDIIYDPTLDDMGWQKAMLDIDMNAIELQYMKGQRKKRHTPARPHDRYALYRATTTTVVLIARRLRSSGVYFIK